MIPLSGYIGAGALLAGALAGWTVRDWKADSDEAEAKDQAFVQYRALTDMLADQSLQLEYTQQALRTGERRDRETIREVYRNVEVSPSCAAPAGVVSVLDNAVERSNASASGEPVSAVQPTP